MAFMALTRRAKRDRLWIDFVNTDERRGGVRVDLLRDLNAFVAFLEQAGAMDVERGALIRRRAAQQPAGAAAALVEARRVRAALRALAERGLTQDRPRADALVEMNRILGRSAGTRRLDQLASGAFTRTFVPTGDAFAGLLIAVVESAADALVAGDLPRVRRCGATNCMRVFLDTSKNGRRRWCNMATCGNRAKAARHRARAVR